MEQEPLRTAGGLSEARPATAEIQEMTEKVRPLLEKKTKKKYEKFEAIEYKVQVVAGLNYFIKVDVGCGCYIHLRVFSGISKENDLELHDYQTNKAKNDELTYF